MNPSEDQQRATVAQREREAAAVNIEGLRRDAERWRWLRGRGFVKRDGQKHTAFVPELAGTVEFIHGDESAMIDALADRFMEAI